MYLDVSKSALNPFLDDIPGSTVRACSSTNTLLPITNSHTDNRNLFKNYSSTLKGIETQSITNIRIFHKNRHLVLIATLVLEETLVQ